MKLHEIDTANGTKGNQLVNRGKACVGVPHVILAHFL